MSAQDIKMNYEHVFSPITINGCTIPNRLVVTAMVSEMCTEDGYATDAYIRYHELKARGGYGLIITEDYNINRNAGGHKYNGGLYDESQIEGHKRLTDTVHKYGTKIFCQIYHAGRQTNSGINGGVQPMAPSPTACPWNREMARELTVEEIHEFARQFGVTARNAKLAGFDGVEIHAGNGYLLAGFMSHYSNHRTDEYGGCFKNRMRFLHEVYTEMREAVGPDYPIMIRYSADEHVLSGRDINETRMIAKMLEDWGIDAINCSNGVYGSFNLAQVSTSYRGHGWTIKNAAELKDVVSIPILGSNSIDDPAMAESFLAQGFCDLVGMARCSLADPDMPNKAREGREEEIRPCVRCVQGCTTNTALEIPLRCLVNPITGNEMEFTFEDEPEQLKKVLIIGGGVAGCEAAIAATRRGHDVTLWEKADRLGGQFVSAAYPPGKGDYITYLCYLVNELKKLGVKVELNREATADDVRAFGADKVIVATGGEPNKLQIPGADNPHVHYAENILRGFEQVEGRIAVIGGSEVACETAMYLADQERGMITIMVRRGPEALMEHVDGTRKNSMKAFLREREVAYSFNTKPVELREDGLLVDCNGEQKLVPVDAVVVAVGYHPVRALADELDDLGDALVVVGDAVHCENAMVAGEQGFRAGYHA